jgi:hypothetical protein
MPPLLVAARTRGSAEGRLGAPRRSRAAIVAWAEEAARRGDYAGALAWLATVEAIGDELSQALAARRRGWSVRMQSARVHAGHPAS